MTDDQINAAIAEACGWTDIFEHPEFGLMGVAPEPHGWWTAVEVYAHCLNAMHEAERHLGESTNMLDYNNALYDMACRAMKQNGKWNPYGATARQRAEAFLKTLGKWEEVQG